jgi:hypothetical protein
MEGGPFRWHGGPLCDRSVLCPVLIVYTVLSNFFLLVKHDADACDGLGRAIYQGLFGDFLTFPLGLYYALKVTSVGLTTWNLLRLCLLASGVGVVQLDAFLVIGVSTCSCRLRQPPQKQSVHIDINREDNQPGMLHQPLVNRDMNPTLTGRVYVSINQQTDSWRSPSGAPWRGPPGPRQTLG